MSKISKIKQFYVKDQFIIEDDNVVIFQSYDSVIASYNKKSKVLTLDRYYWVYSRITTKYLYKFINEYCYNVFCCDIHSKVQVKYLINNNKILFEDLSKKKNRKG